MRKFKDVEYTNPFELLFLFASTVAVFALTMFLLNRMMSFGLLKAILAFVIAGIYYLLFKKKFTVKKADFTLTSDMLEWNKKRIDFINVVSYKIHWMKGAGIKFNLRNGKVLRISSNDHFCNSEKFVSLCRKIDSRLSKYNNNQIIRKKSFFETKQGYYFAVILTILVVCVGVFRQFTGDGSRAGNVALMSVSLGILWTGITLKRRK